MARKKAVPKALRKHPLWEDPEVPPDHRGSRRCRRCGVMGQPGDVRHSEEFPEVPVEDVSDRILGESGS